MQIRGSRVSDFDLNFFGSEAFSEQSGGGGTAADRLLEGLNPPQREAVLHDEGPLLILAGAGSGKTRVITKRIGYLIEVRGVSPFAVLAITFTNKAAAEMKQRINELVGSVSERMWVGTFHSMFARILRRHADLLGYSQNFTIADTADSQQMIKQLVREMNLDDKKFDARMVLSQISGAKNALHSPEKYREIAGENPIFKQVARIYKNYQERMLQANCMDFDDILTNTVKLFTKHKEVLEVYQERFRYVLVDEYQDTNSAQYQIVKLLAAKHRNLCVVGDDDQSIYSFRGADIRNILDFEKDYKNCKTIKLEQNYRSTETILSAANAVIANNKGRKAKKLWTGAQEGEAFTFVRANNHFDEARYIAKEILLRRQRLKSLKYMDFAILYRANALSRVLESALREAGIPYRIYGGLRFYDRKEIKDVLAYLRLVASDRDELAFLRAVNTPRRGIGDTTIESLQRESALTGEPMLKLCATAEKYPNLSRSAGKLTAFAQIIFDMRSKLIENSINFQEYVEYVQEHSGLLDAILEDRALGKDNAAERIENLKELLSDALEFSQSAIIEDAAFFEYGNSRETAGGSDEKFELVFDESENRASSGETKQALTESLSAFLARAALYSEQDLENSEEDFIRLMTIHSAKGLEFSHVFLVCAENGVFPSSRSMSEESGLEEERRLAYVAITRAKKKLYITTARTRTLYGQTLANPVSIFVKEIPAKYLEELGGSSRGEQAAYGSPFGNSSTSGYGGASTPYGGFIQGQNRSVNVSNGSSDAGNRFSQASQGLDPTAMNFLKGKSTSSDKGQASTNTQFLKVAEIRIGMRVESARYGRGSILNLEPVAGDAIIEVQFGTNRPKKMLLNAAKLRAVEE